MVHMRRVGVTTGNGTVDHTIIQIDFEPLHLVCGADHSASWSERTDAHIGLKRKRTVATGFRCRMNSLRGDVSVYCIISRFDTDTSDSCSLNYVSNASYYFLLQDSEA
jgi:hypothetical protein